MLFTVKIRNILNIIKSEMILHYNDCKGPSIKDICSRGSLSSVDILQTRGFFRCRRLHFLAWKKIRFFGILCPHGQRGREVKPVRTSGWGSIFCDFVQMSFMDMSCESVFWNFRDFVQMFFMDMSCESVFWKAILLINYVVVSINKNK